MDGFRDADSLGGFATWDTAAKAKDANRISQQVQGAAGPALAPGREGRDGV